MNRLDRRTFIKQGLAAAVAVSFPSACAYSIGRLERKGASSKILVVGAGLAGLSAAYELTKAGHDVAVLEARTRTGGRVYTVRTPFSEGQYAEGGAARIPADHELTLSYARHFGLALEEFYPPDFIHYRRGKRETIDWKAFDKLLRKYFDIALGKDRRNVFKIKGGNDLLPAAFELRLRDKIIFDAPVLRIEQDASGVRAAFARGGLRETRAADYLVCSIPFTLLRKVEVSPQFSEAKRKVVEHLSYDVASRVLIQTKKRFWAEQRLSGFGVTDAPLEIWQPTMTQGGARGILATYPRGTISERLTALGEEERVAQTVELLEGVFPGARANFEAGISKCWVEDEWARGAWAHPSDEELKHAMRPEGRIYFAGEHTSQRPSWMQGALESGQRVAREVNDTARV
ncbi:MAG TPA: FAD-dependent oxidoreductase [Pyrinomonadaceae bacterium]|nr:FAD-dependent oxidoreductase [Pyrinomonadaceae bacterium]